MSRFARVAKGERAFVAQAVLPVTPVGSPAARKEQVNVPASRDNNLPYIGATRRLRHGPKRSTVTAVA